MHERGEKKRWVNNVGPIRGGAPTHTGIYLFCLTRSFRVMHVSLKQSVNQSHTNSQGSLVAISYGVDAQYPWSERAAIDPSVRVCALMFDCHDGEQYCDSALTIDCLLVALRRSVCVCVCVCISTHICVSRCTSVINVRLHFPFLFPHPALIFSFLKVIFSARFCAGVPT